VRVRDESVLRDRERKQGVEKCTSLKLWDFVIFALHQILFVLCDQIQAVRKQRE
jgi:hypothetical protein